MVSVVISVYVGMVCFVSEVVDFWLFVFSFVRVVLCLM